MLKLTLRPGEHIDIGEEIRVVFSGGSANNIHLLLDAPKSFNITRSSAGKKRTASYYKEPDLSLEARQQIYAILKKERMKRQQ